MADAPGDSLHHYRGGSPIFGQLGSRIDHGGAGRAMNPHEWLTKTTDKVESWAASQGPDYLLGRYPWMIWPLIGILGGSVAAAVRYLVTGQ